MIVDFLKSFNGDCIHISFTDPDGHNRNILIDGGIAETYQLDKDKDGKVRYGSLKLLIDKVSTDGQRFDLLILTHIDDDHIGGILKWFDNDKQAHKLIGEVWFNSGRLIARELGKPENGDTEHLIKPQQSTTLSIAQGVTFSKYIAEKGIWFERLIMQGDVLQRFGLTFRILSPDRAKLERLLKKWKKKDPDLRTGTPLNDYKLSVAGHIAADKYRQDNAYPNGSSIAFILTYKNHQLLFLGDSHPAVIIRGLKLFKFGAKKPLQASMIKLAHHGSKGNTSPALLKCISANDYVISTDGRTHQHPHKQMLSRLISINGSCNIHFNYADRMNAIFSPQDRKAYPDFTITALAGGMQFD